MCVDMGLTSSSGIVTIASLFRSFFLPFFFNDTATTEIYTLSLHDALPICAARHLRRDAFRRERLGRIAVHGGRAGPGVGEHTSELQARQNLLCRVLLGKKK